MGAHLFIFRYFRSEREREIHPTCARSSMNTTSIVDIRRMSREDEGEKEKEWKDGCSKEGPINRDGSSGISVIVRIFVK